MDLNLIREALAYASWRPRRVAGAEQYRRRAEIADWSIGSLMERVNLELLREDAPADSRRARRVGNAARYRRRADAEWSIGRLERVEPERMLHNGRPSAEWLVAQEVEQLLSTSSQQTLLPKLKPQHVFAPAFRFHDADEVLGNCPPQVHTQLMRFHAISLVHVPTLLQYYIDSGRSRVLSLLQRFLETRHPRFFYSAVAVLASVSRVLRHLHLYNHVLLSHYPRLLKQAMLLAYFFPECDRSLTYDFIALLCKVACKLDTSLSNLRYVLFNG